MTTFVEIKKLPHGEDLPLPTYAHEGDSGVDLLAAIEDGVWTIAPGERMLIPCGIAIALPFGFEAQVRSRSGLALKYGVCVLNSPGTIDEGYRGEIGVVLINHGKDAFFIKRGDRIAQMVFAPVSRVEFIENSVLGSTVRGADGYGSTGVSVDTGRPPRKITNSSTGCGL